MLVGCHGSSLSLGTRVEVVCEGASQGGGPGRSIAEAHKHQVVQSARITCFRGNPIPLPSSGGSKKYDKLKASL